MFRGERKKRFSSRVGSLERELAEVNRRIRKVSRGIERQGGWSPGGVGSSEPPSLTERQPSASGEDLVREGPAPRWPSGSVPATVLPPPRLPDRRAGSSRAAPRGDEQFASYFMSGGLKGAQAAPRQEHGVQRAKALFLVLCFVLLLFALLFFKIWR